MMQAEIWERLNRNPLFLDQTSQPLEVERAEVEQFYIPLAQTLLARSAGAARWMAAVAGPPGSGKTAFATLLAAVIEAVAGQRLAGLAGLDGWHYPNSYLDSHFIERGGERIPLRRIKGAPESFDYRAAQACLVRLRQGGRVEFPVYSRRLHDPLPGGGVVESSQRIVILEGNYWLLAEPPWLALQPLFDLRIFLKAGRQDLLDGLRERHLRGGKDPETVEQHLQAVDLPNIELVINYSIRPDLIVHKADSRRIERMEWLE